MININDLEVSPSRRKMSSKKRKLRILYIYPHPDDESFGTAHVMSKQHRQGHEVYLLTLTKGGATKQRLKYNYSIDKMGEIRSREMMNVAKVLDLSGLNILDLPDGKLKEMDPRGIEDPIKKEIMRVQPHVVVTYAVHGISRFHDHLVTHASVKHAFVELKGKISNLKRLAFHTISEEQANEGKYFNLEGSKEEEIDCIVHVEKQDIQNAYKALDCYITYIEIIKRSNIKSFIKHNVAFEIYQENHTPPLSDLFDSL